MKVVVLSFILVFCTISCGISNVNKDKKKLVLVDENGNPARMNLQRPRFNDDEEERMKIENDFATRQEMDGQDPIKQNMQQNSNKYAKFSDQNSDINGDTPLILLDKSGKSKGKFEDRTSSSPKLKSGIYVQVGVFENDAKAQELLKKYKAKHNGTIIEMKSKNSRLNKVVLGPFKNESAAKSIMKKVKSSGGEAFIIRL